MQKIINQRTNRCDTDPRWRTSYLLRYLLRLGCLSFCQCTHIYNGCVICITVHIVTCVLGLNHPCLKTGIPSLWTCIFTQCKQTWQHTRRLQYCWDHGRENGNSDFANALVVILKSVVSQSWLKVIPLPSLPDTRVLLGLYASAPTGQTMDCISYTRSVNFFYCAQPTHSVG